MLVNIGIGHDQRILDHRPGANGEQSIEAAIERDVGHDRHQHGWQHRDDREQTDNLNVQTGCRPAAPPGLNHLPDFTGDNRQQEQDGGAVNQQEGDNDVVGWRDRG